MTTLVLVRHALTASTGKRLYGRQPGMHLDDRGRAQAASAADRLARLDIAAVYASPLERAQETARPIAAAAGLRVRTREGLLEVDVGEWTGRALGHLRRRKDWREVQQVPSRFRFPGGESFLEAQQRAVAAIERLATAHPGDTIVAVSHADTLKVAVAHFLGLALDQFQRIMIAPASISVMVLQRGAPPMLVGLNDTAHLHPTTEPGKPSP